MKLSALSITASLATVLALGLATSSARADECKDIHAALSKRAEALAKVDAKGGALCAGMGQLLGLIEAGRIVAEQCLEGDELKKTAADLDETIKAMEGGIKEQCK
jgi:hypothetical protein